MADLAVLGAPDDNVIDLLSGRHARIEGGKHRAPRVPLTERMVDGVLDGVAAGVSRTAPVLVPVLGAGALTAGTVFTGGSFAAAAPTGHTNTTSTTAGFQLPTGTPYAQPTDQQLLELRGCESGGNYAINTGNGFFGAYQFNQGTWAGLGLPGLASQASPALQDAAASALEMERGWEPWPSCSARLGLSTRKPGSATQAVILTDFTAASGATKSPTSTPKPAAPKTHKTAAPASAPAVTTTGAPAYDGTVLTTAYSSTYRSDVRTWQERMADRGWAITADGYFGPQSASVAKSFAAEKGLHVALPGEVDKTVWTAAWTLAVN